MLFHISNTFSGHSLGDYEGDSAMHEVYSQPFASLPWWQKSAIIRSENKAVLRGVDAGLSRAEISNRNGIPLFRVLLAERRLVRQGELEYT